MRKNTKIAGAAGLAAIMLVGGTFAYFNQTMKVENPFDTGKYDTKVTEDFKPQDGENWEPGAEVNKDVNVLNTGDYDVLVRVKFDEKWVNKDTGATVKENAGMDDSTSQDNATDGLVEKDGSVVAKTLNKENWVYNGADGYWYYNQNLKADGETGTFLDAVKLLEDADMGNYIVTNYYTTAADKPAEDVIGDDVWTETFTRKPEPLTAEEKKAWLAQVSGVALGSDAFFPFGDNIERARRSGVTAIVQPGGSIRDQQVIDTCNKYGIAMAFCGIRLVHH